MGVAASASEDCQVAIVTFPANRSELYGALALVPMLPKYFPTPESARTLYDLFNEDGVRRTFWKARPTPSLEGFYMFFIASCAAGRELGASSGEPVAIPVALALLHKGIDKWEWSGMFSCRIFNKDGQISGSNVIGAFKRYTGASGATDGDIALAMIRGAVAQYAAGARRSSDGRVQWPKPPVAALFTRDNSATAALLSRMFKYYAMRLAGDSTIDIDISVVTNSFGVDQHKTELRRACDIDEICETLANDPSLQVHQTPSLSTTEFAGIAELTPIAPGESFLHIRMRPSNDSNFNRKGLPRALDISAKFKAIHDECRSLAHRDLCVDEPLRPAEAVAANDPADALFRNFGLPRPPNSQRELLKKSFNFALLMSMPPTCMVAPAKPLRHLVNTVTCRVAAATPFAQLYGDDSSSPTYSQRLEKMCDIVRSDPFLALTALCVWRSGCEGRTRQVLCDELRASVQDAWTPHAGAGAASEPWLGAGGSSHVCRARLVDLRMRNLISPDLDEVRKLLRTDAAQALGLPIALADEREVDVAFSIATCAESVLE